MAGEGKPTDSPGLDVRVEQDETGWVVVADVEGERKQFGAAHPDREQADLYAHHMFSGSDRWRGAAEVDRPRPETYPNDGDGERA